jgi:hypothetical protein
MEAIVASSAKPARPSEECRDELIDLATRLRSGDEAVEELDRVTDRLLTALPRANIMALLFDNHPELTIDEAIDVALRRESEADSSRPT